MSWKIIEKYRSLLQAEHGAVSKNWGGKLAVCLVYPNEYRTGMSNLGFQTVYSLLNAHPDVVCERAFLPANEELEEYRRSGTRLLSLESQRPLSEFDIIAFSISFEADYLAVPKIFSLAGIPPFCSERTDADPLVMAGGAALFLNPEPVADFVDAIAVGEAEPLLEPLMGLFRIRGINRDELLVRVAALPGMYVPSGYVPEYDGGSLNRLDIADEFPQRVERVCQKEMDRQVAMSRIITSDTEFGDMFLVEVSRGCPRGCRFCAASFIYHPYRHHSLEVLKEAVDAGLAMGLKIGLVGAAVSDHRDLLPLCRYIVERGGKFSVSSLRIDGINAEIVEYLKASGQKTIALAPEGGSQRLRNLIRKGIDEEQILSACDILIGHDVLNLKLYFIIGLPTETEGDLEELVDLVKRIRERVVERARKNRRLGEIVLSVNPFVPKPFTPLQWCGMEELKSIERKGKYLEASIRKLSNVRMQMENPKEAYLQAVLSRGDRRLAHFLVQAAELGNWRKAAKQRGWDLDSIAYRNMAIDDPFPWQTMTGAEQEYLRMEYRRAFGGGG